MYQINGSIYILIDKYMNIYNQYMRQMPVDKFIKIVHLKNICCINLRFFNENSCKIYG